MTSSRALVALLTVLSSLLLAPSAFAGRVLITGHDSEFHCTGGTSDPPGSQANDNQCGYVRTAVNYVRGESTKPVLVLDRNASGEDTTKGTNFEQALQKAFGTTDGANPDAPSNLPLVVMDPRGATFASEPLDVAKYSAILVASDTTCGGCTLNEFDSTPDSDAINARASAFEAYFNAGGGIFANAGASHGDGDPSNGADNFYNFIPIPVGAKPVSAPFTLTEAGKAIGFEDSTNADASKRVGTRDDINCCATHNSFSVPDLGTFSIAETDSANLAETLFADGEVRDGSVSSRVAAPPALGVSAVVRPKSGTITVKVPGSTEFRSLRGSANIPVGSSVDAARGVVSLTSARNSTGGTQSADFSKGRFKLRQNRRTALTELRLEGGSFQGCSSRSSSSDAVASGRRVRRLFGSGRGRFSTRGRFGAATVRGTKWLTEDQCDGTVFKVTQGSIKVKDFVTKRTVTVKRGRTYKAEKRTRRRSSR